MRFKEYLLLEKVTKKEMKDVLNNSNILIGAEFEFIYDQLSDRAATEDLEGKHDDAMRDYENWKEEYEEWKREIEELESEIEKTKSYIESMEEDFDSIEDEHEREEFQKKIDDEHDTLDDLKRDLETKRMEEPSIGRDYKEYMNLIDPNWYMIQNVPEPPEPDEVGMGGLDNERDWLEVAKEVLPPIISGTDFIDSYEIGGYGDVIQTKENQVWAFEYDSTVSGQGGVEMKSPPMPLPDFIDILPKILTFINDNGSTNSETGLHFHMSIDGKNKMEVDMVKLILFTDEGLIWKFFPERVDNEYTKSVRNKLLKGMDPQQLKNYINDLTGLKEIPDDKIKEIKGEHYDAIHQVGTKGTHVEFRHPGGQGYHRKLSKIKRLIGNYAFTLSVAVDPEYKYKEYIRKVIRIINKVEKYILKQKFEYLTSNNGIEADLKRLESSGKASERDLKFIRNYIEKRRKEIRQQIKKLGVNISSEEERIIGQFAQEGQDSELKKVYDIAKRRKK